MPSTRMVDAGAVEAEAAVVMDEVAPGDRVRVVVDAGEVIEADLGVLEDPAGAEAHGADLGVGGKLLDGQGAEGDVGRAAAKRPGGDAGLDGLAGRVVPEVDRVGGVVEEPLAGAAAGEAGDVGERDVVDEQVLGIDAAGMGRRGRP